MALTPVELLAVLAVFVAFIFTLSQAPPLAKLFDTVPPVIWVYALPAVASTFGLLPKESALYSLLSGTVLPAALVLLLIGTDLKAVAQLGFRAVALTLAGSVGIVLGAAVALSLFGAFLPPEAWSAFGALSGSWTGGNANMIAVKESIGTPDSVFGAAVAMDFLVGYSWTVILLFLSRYQTSINRWLGADEGPVDQVLAQLDCTTQERTPLTVPGIIGMLGLALGLSGLCFALGRFLPEFGGIVTAKTWGFILVTTVALALSLTPVRRLEAQGASQLGYGFLYLVLAGLGAQGDLSIISQYPVFLLAGVVWIAVHALVLILVARLTKTPWLLVAVASQANTGGVVSTPIVAAVYRAGAAPLGLLMAVLGNIVGTYMGLTAAVICQAIARSRGWI